MRRIAMIGIAAIACLPALASRRGRRSNIHGAAQYSGADNGGGRNCGFSTIEQCRATISGMGGFCEPNPFYPGSTNGTSQGKRKRQH